MILCVEWGSQEYVGEEGMVVGQNREVVAPTFASYAACMSRAFAIDICR